jgi:ATP-dependent protease HslVU (ClpYQ) peptidase subunit
MSLVVGIKRNGYVYLGADTQITAGIRKTNYTQENNYKIIRYPNDILIGVVGSVASFMQIKYSDDVLKIPKDKKLTKKLVLNYIVNPLYKQFKKNERITTNEKGIDSQEVTYMIAKHNQLFLVFTGGGIIEISDYVAIGSAERQAYQYLAQYNNVEPEVLIKNALSFSSAYDQGVSSPFILINTNSYEYELVRSAYDISSKT